MFIYGNNKFNTPTKIIKAYNNDDFYKAVKEIQKLQNEFYLVGYISYQAKEIFLDKKISTSSPLLYFEAHKKYEDFTVSKAQKANLFIKENIDFERYSIALEKIKNYIKQGTTYEVNYTFSNDVFCNIDGYHLFLDLIQNQKTPYCAYIKNEFDEILSFSPELFFKIENNKITTKPMKGTAKRNGNDEEEINFLKTDKKNLAENTMIVDLIRNDLSKIKSSFDIKVEKLFEVETHKTLHQMTSTISAKISEFDFLDILACLFPCGSITGAPKISTMKIIDELENYKRNIYCGMIGYLYKNECNFSVPIRILEKKTNDNFFTFSQGGAIVIKSDTEDEWKECKTKKMFLGDSVDFDLIETILIKNNQPQLFFEHLKRLKTSCEKFNFKFNNNLLNEKFQNNKIAKIILKRSGDYKIQYRDFDLIKTNKIEISKTKVYSKNSFLFHKTTFKPWYIESYEKIKRNEIFDTIFLNEKDELTEGSRSNILLETDGILYTPSIECGLLNGVFRQKLLDENKIKEKILKYEDILKAQKIYLINSVRGITEVQL